MFSGIRSVWITLRKWFDSTYRTGSDGEEEKPGIDWLGAVPFLTFHLLCFGILLVGWSPFAVLFGVIFYLVRMFGITAFYHRYFSHNAFKANRFFSFLFAFLGCSAMQKGPLWWAAIHRHHHRFVDTEKDIHSPLFRGFWYSHIGWILARENKKTRTEYIGDWLKYRELVFLDKYAIVVAILTAIAVYFLGEFLYYRFPHLQTNGLQLLVWGFVVSTVLCSHATFSINSIDHMFGSRRYDLANTSRNNVLMALLTLGEGWHNNHHHYAVTARAGFYWWEIDATYYLLVMLSRLHIVRDLRPLPAATREKNHLPGK